MSCEQRAAFLAGADEMLAALDATGSAQPLLEHDEAEQELVVVLPAGSVILEKFSHRLRLKQLEHERAFIHEQFRKLAFKRRSKPFVHHVDGEAALLSLEDARRQITSRTPAGAAICDVPLRILKLAPSRWTYSTTVRSR